MNAHPKRSADVLVVSNGFGEAAIATYIARAIRARAPLARVEHFPLVGNPQPTDWPPLVGPRADMPSGGLVTYWNVRNLIRDLRAGLAGLTVAQYRYLAQQRSRDVVIAVGDIYCLALCLVAARRPTVFVATAKSDLVARHSSIERAIARHAQAAFARDAATAASLRSARVPAEYAGNIMMDGLERSGIDLGVLPSDLNVAVLPGSRADAETAMAAQTERLIAIAELLTPRGRTVHALVALAPSILAQDVCRSIERLGFSMRGHGEGPGLIASGRRENLRISLVRGAFGDLIGFADIVLGQAGTANEQAAGSGKPVIAAAQPGEVPSKMGWYRMRQKKLLGDALLVLPGESRGFAAEIVRLVDDPVRLEHMATIGRERMGGAGGADAVAARTLAIAARDGVA